MYCPLILFHSSPLPAPEGPPQDFRDDLVPDFPERRSFMWLPPLESLRNGNITNYSIDCIPDNTSLTTVYHDGPITTAVVRGFTSGSRYTCFINASTSVGAGPSSEGLPVTTGILYMYMVSEVMHPLPRIMLYNELNAIPPPPPPPTHTHTHIWLIHILSC